MNWYYVLAILCTALAMGFGYLGSSAQSKKDSSEDRERIEGQLRELGTKIQTLQSQPTESQSTESIQTIENEYISIAEEFYKSLPLEVAEQRSKTAAAIAEQVKTSGNLSKHLQKLELEASKLVQAFNSSTPTGQIRLVTAPSPSNFYDQTEAKPYKLLFSFASNSYWAVRFVYYADKSLALQFVKLRPMNPKEMAPVPFENLALTNDSINLILREKDFLVSLNSVIANSVKTRIVDPLAGAHLMTEFDDASKGLVERIIKYELLELSLHSNK